MRGLKYTLVPIILQKPVSRHAENYFQGHRDGKGGTVKEKRESGASRTMKEPPAARNGLVLGNHCPQLTGQLIPIQSSME